MKAASSAEAAAGGSELIMESEAQFLNDALQAWKRWFLKCRGNSTNNRSLSYKGAGLVETITSYHISLSQSKAPWTLLGQFNSVHLSLVPLLAKAGFAWPHSFSASAQRLGFSTRMGASNELRQPVGGQEHFRCCQSTGWVPHGYHHRLQLSSGICRTWLSTRSCDAAVGWSETCRDGICNSGSAACSAWFGWCGRVLSLFHCRFSERQHFTNHRS